MEVFSVEVLVWLAPMVDFSDRELLVVLACGFDVLYIRRGSVMVLRSCCWLLGADRRWYAVVSGMWSVGLSCGGN